MNDYESKIKRLNYLNSVSLFNDNEWNEIAFLSMDNDEEIRKQVAELLGFHHCDKSENILVSMLNDADYLVRTEACDSLCFSASESVQKILIDLCSNDLCTLVRGYAVLAIGDIQVNIGKKLDIDLKEIILAFAKADSEWIQIAVYRTLAKTGYKEYQKKLIEKIESVDYRNRIFAISMIHDVVSDMDSKNIEILSKKLKKLKKTEKIESVLSSLYNLIAVVETNRNNDQGTVRNH